MLTGSALSPLKGVGPDELKLDRLIDRIKKGNFKEIIIATNPTVEGEATAHYLVKIFKDLQVKLTRLAMGLPVGSDIDFADQVFVSCVKHVKIRNKNYIYFFCNKNHDGTFKSFISF